MEDELHRLRAENRRLRRENEYLRHRAEQLGDHTAAADKTEAVMRDAARTMAISRSRSYIGYLLLSLKMSRSFRLYDRTTFAVRNFFFFSKIWRILTGVFAVLGISAKVLLTLGALAVLLPAAAVFSAVAALIGFFAHLRWNRAFVTLLAGRKVYLLFAPKKRQGSGYFDAMARELAEDGVVLIISRSFAACGFSGVRALGDGRYRIHTSYYFSLAGRLDAVGAVRIIKIN